MDAKDAASDPEYLSRLIDSTRVKNPRRVEMHFQSGLKLLIVEGDLGTVRVAPQQEETWPAVAGSANPTDEGNLIQWLVEYRRKNAISIQRLAKIVRISAGSLKAYFSFRREPGEIILARIQEFKNSLE